VVGHRAKQQGRGDRGQHQVGQVQVPLAWFDRGEPVGERQREQEPEQHLHAEAGHSQLLQQLGEIAVIPLGLRLVPGVRGCCLFHRTSISSADRSARAAAGTTVRSAQ